MSERKESFKEVINKTVDKMAAIGELLTPPLRHRSIDLSSKQMGKFDSCIIHVVDKLADWGEWLTGQHNSPKN